MTNYGLMWDSASGAYPHGIALGAYYFNGRFRRQPVVYQRGNVWIDVNGSAPKAASWLDVEKGDATPADVPGWLDERDMPGNQGIYCDRSNVIPVIHAAAGRPMNLWVATLDGTTVVTTPKFNGIVAAVQAFNSKMAGFNVDISVVTNEAYWNRHAILRL